MRCAAQRSFSQQEIIKHHIKGMAVENQYADGGHYKAEYCDKLIPLGPVCNSE